VPHVLPAEVDVAVDDGGRQTGHRVDDPRGMEDRLAHRVEDLVCHVQDLALGHGRVDQPNAVGNLERDVRQERPERHDRVLQRADPHRFLPPQLVGVRQPFGPVPADPVQQLHVVQVEVNGVGVHAVVRDLPDLSPVGQRRQRSPADNAFEDFHRRGGVGVEREILGPGHRLRHFEPQVSAHPTVFTVERLAHLVLNGLRLQGEVAHDVPRHALEGDRVVLDADNAPVRPGRREGGVVRGVVGGLPDDDRVLAPREDALRRRRRLEGVLQRDQIKGRGHRGSLHLDLHDRPRVGTVAHPGPPVSARVRHVRRARVVVVARVEGRERGGGVVVNDQGLAGIRGEVDDHVGPLRRTQQQRVVRHVPEVEGRRVHVPGDGPVRDHRRRRQEAALVGDLDPLRTHQHRIGNAALAAIRRPLRRQAGVRRRGNHAHLRQSRLTRVRVGEDRVRVGLIELEVEEPVVGRVQDSKTVGLGLHLQRRIRRAVDDRRIAEHLHSHGGVRRPGNLRRLPGRVHRIVIGVRHRPVRDVLRRRPEPGTVVPPAEGVDPFDVVRVLGGHVDVRQPEVARLRLANAGGRVQQARSPVPRGIGDAHQLRIHERPVLEHQGNLLRGNERRVDQLLLDRIGNEVARRLAHVDVQPRDAPGMIVVEHEAGALLVRPVERHRPLARIGHVWNVLHAHALGVRRRFAGRGDPLVRRAVADPRALAAVKVQRGPVLGEHVPLHWTHPRAHHGRIARDEQVAALARRQGVGELDAHGPVLLGDDDRPQVVDRRRRHVVRSTGGVRAHVGLHVAPQRGRRQVRVHLLRVLAELDLVVVRARIRDRVRIRHREILSQVVRLGRPQARQRVHELAHAAGERAAHLGCGGGAAARRVRDRDRRQRIAAAGSGHTNGLDRAAVRVNRRRGRGAGPRRVRDRHRGIGVAAAPGRHGNANDLPPRARAVSPVGAEVVRGLPGSGQHRLRPHDSRSQRPGLAGLVLLPGRCQSLCRGFPLSLRHSAHFPRLGLSGGVGLLRPARIGDPQGEQQGRRRRQPNRSPDWMCVHHFHSLLLRFTNHEDEPFNDARLSLLGEKGENRPRALTRAALRSTGRRDPDIGFGG